MLFKNFFTISYINPVYPKISNLVPLKSFQYYSLINTLASEHFLGFPSKIPKHFPNPLTLHLCHPWNYPWFCVPRSIWQIPRPRQQNKRTLKQVIELFLTTSFTVVSVYLLVFSVPQQPKSALGRFVVEVPRSPKIRHTHTHLLGLLKKADQLVEEATT